MTSLELPAPRRTAAREMPPYLGSTRAASTRGSSSITSRWCTCLREMSSTTKSCCGRARHDGTIALPGEFIPQAEERGVMPEIDLWVIEKAFDLLKADAKLRLFVNLSVTSLESDLIPNRVEERLARDPIEPGRLILELTETAPVRNWQRVQATIQRLSRSGCSFLRSMTSERVTRPSPTCKTSPKIG